MRTTPLKKKTLWVSIILAGIAVICIPFGWFLASAIAGTASAINLLAGALLKGH